MTPAAPPLDLAGCPPGKTCLVGVSGGRDSMALLHALVQAGYKKLVVCHLDHGLRPGHRELALLEKTCSRLGCDLETGQADTPSHARDNRLSVETAARDLRYKFFEACATARRCPRVILAHHADDQLETILFNIFRGTGTSGLSGMKPISHLGKLTLLRPWLAVPREDIEAFARKSRIRFCDDPTNSDLRFTRNHVRGKLIPLLEEIFGPSFRTALLRLSEISRAEEEFLSASTPPPGEKLPVQTLRSLPQALQRRHVLRWLREQNIHEPGFADVENVLRLLDLTTAKVNLPKNRHARRRGGQIFLDQER